MVAYRLWISVIAVVVLRAGTPLVSGGKSSAWASSHAVAPAAKKKCTTKTAHGKKRKVCKPAKAKSTSTPQPTATPDTSNEISDQPVFPGVPAGGFVPGASGTVTLNLPASSAHVRPHVTALNLAPRVNLVRAGYQSFHDYRTSICVDLVLVIADARGFKMESRPTVIDTKTNGAAVDLTGIIESISVPSALDKSVYAKLGDFPYAAQIGVQVCGSEETAGSFLVKYLASDGANAGNLVLVDDNIQIRPTPGTSVASNSLVRFDTTLPSGLPLLYQASQIDTAVGTFSVPVIISPNGFNPLAAGNTPATYFSPGTHMVFTPLNQSPTLELDHQKLSLTWGDAIDAAQKALQHPPTFGSIAIPGLNLGAVGPLSIPGLTGWTASTSPGSSMLLISPPAGTSTWPASVQVDVGANLDLTPYIDLKEIPDLVFDENGKLIVAYSSTATVGLSSPCMASIGYRAPRDAACPMPPPPAKHSFTFTGLHASFTDPFSRSHDVTISGSSCRSDPMTGIWTVTLRDSTLPNALPGSANFNLHDPDPIYTAKFNSDSVEFDVGYQAGTPPQISLTTNGTLPVTTVNGRAPVQEGAAC